MGAVLINVASFTATDDHARTVFVQHVVIAVVLFT